MENVTHALAGVLLAELVLTVRAARGAPHAPTVARLAYVTSAVANNVPDADILYDTLLIPGKLGYLLHHRGHTHTLLVGVALGLLVAAVVRLYAKLRKRELERRDTRLLFALGAAGPVLHITMDGWNSYGVHPFWPLDGRWFYGDAIFIVEPLFWITAIGPLFALARGRAWRVVLGALGAIILALPWLMPHVVPLPVRIALLLIAAGTVALVTFVRASRRVAIAIGGWAVVFASFALGSRLSRAEVRQSVTQEDARLVVHDIALTPMPANPLCFTAIAVLSHPDGDLVVRHLVVAPLPSLVAAETCPSHIGKTTAPLSPPGPDSVGVRSLGEFRAPVDELRHIVQERCDAAALARFLRAPYWKYEGSRLVVGDMRFDRDEGLDFAEMDLPLEPPSAESCPRFIPGWRPPRQDLLE